MARPKEDIIAARHKYLASRSPCSRGSCNSSPIRPFDLPPPRAFFVFLRQPDYDTIVHAVTPPPTALGRTTRNLCRTAGLSQSLVLQNQTRTRRTSWTVCAAWLRENSPCFRLASPVVANFGSRTQEELPMLYHPPRLTGYDEPAPGCACQPSPLGLTALKLVIYLDLTDTLGIFFTLGRSTQDGA